MYRFAVACLLAVGMTSGQQSASIDPYSVEKSVEMLEEPVDESQVAEMDEEDEADLANIHGRVLKPRRSSKKTYRAPASRRSSRARRSAPKRSAYTRTTSRRPPRRTKVVVRKRAYVRPSRSIRVRSRRYRAPVRRAKVVLRIGRRSGYYRTTSRRSKIVLRRTPNRRRRTVIIRRNARALAPAMMAFAAAMVALAM